MAWSSKVFILLLVIVSLITTPGRCQQSQTNSSSGTSSSPTVITLSIIGGIVGFVAIIVPVFVYMCYRVSKAKQQRRDFYIAAPSSQTQAVYLSYSSQTTTTAPAQQQAPPTVVYNASYSHYHDSAGNYSGGRPYQSRVLYSIDDQPNDSRASAPQNTRRSDVHRNDKQASTSMNLPEATLQAGVEPPTYEEAINIETPSTQQTLAIDNQPPPYTLDSTDTTN